MNGWSDQYSLVLPPAAVVVGIIRIGSEERLGGPENDDSLHATLCRLAGIEASEYFLPTLPCGVEPAGQIELSADMPQLTADLAEEYHELVAALGS